MTTSKQYDNLGRLTSVSTINSQPSTIASSAYAYNPANQRTAVTNADGSYWLYGYDALGQVTSGKRYWADNTPVAGQQFEYGFDDIGNRRTASAGGDASGANLRQASYNANTLNQYTSRTVPPFAEVQGTAATNATVTVNNQAAYRKGTYFRKELAVLNLDAPVWVGITNIAVVQDAPNPDIVTTNQGHLFLGETPEIFTHDADGNLKENAEWRLSWDGENRLTSLETTFNAAAAGKPRQMLAFAYDHQSRRVEKIVAAWNGSAYAGQNTNRFVYDGWNLVAILDGNNQLDRSFAWGTDLSGSLQGAGGVGGLISMTVHQGTNAGTYFPALDGNGNVRAYVNAATVEVAAEFEYAPFGKLLRATGPLARDCVFLFSTKFYDWETGLYYYGYRHYDPDTGRWLSRDPLAELLESSDADLYLMLNNDNVNSTDFLGFFGNMTSATWSPSMPYYPPPPPPPPQQTYCCSQWTARFNILYGPSLWSSHPNGGSYNSTYAQCAINRVASQNQWVYQAIQTVAVTSGLTVAQQIAKMAQAGGVSKFLGTFGALYGAAKAVQLTNAIGNAGQWCSDRKCTAFTPKVVVTHPVSRWSPFYWVGNRNRVCVECPSGSQEVTLDGNGEVWKSYNEWLQITGGN